MTPLSPSVPMPPTHRIQQIQYFSWETVLELSLKVLLAELKEPVCVVWNRGSRKTISGQVDHSPVTRSEDKGRQDGDEKKDHDKNRYYCSVELLRFLSGPPWPWAAGRTERPVDALLTDHSAGRRHGSSC